MNKQSVIRAVGGYLPAKKLTNKDLSAIVDTTDEWIVQRTGIRQRHLAADSEYTSDLAVKAAQNALERSDLAPSDIDLVLVATCTPDLTFPSTASIVQAKLGIEKGYAFDIAAVCSGFVYALATADAHLKNGLASRALVIGAETMSRILDWEDRTTCVLFGDGAGAMILEAQPDTQSGVLFSHLGSNGAYCDRLYVDGGVSSSQTTGKLKMQGRDVFKHAVQMMTESIQYSLEKTGFTTDDVDWFVPHQANIRIIEAIAQKLNIDPGKTVITVDRHANTSAATIPLALSEAVEDGRIKPGHLVMLEAMGGGFTWGSNLIRW